MISILLTVITLGFATLATIVAFGGSTFHDGKPIWHLNLRGKAASACLVASLFGGLLTEWYQIQKEDVDRSEMARLNKDLSKIRDELAVSQRENEKSLRTITDLQNDIQLTTRSIQSGIDSKPVKIVLEENEHLGFILKNRGTQADLEAEIDEYVYLIVGGSARRNGVIYPLFGTERFGVDWNGFTNKNLTLLNVFYGLIPNNLRNFQNELEKKLSVVAKNRWGSEFEISTIVDITICAKIEVLDEDGGLHREYFGLSAGFFSPPRISNVERRGENFRSCKATHESITEDNIFQHSFEHSLYFIEDFLDFLGDRMYTEGDF